MKVSEFITSQDILKNNNKAKFVVSNGEEGVTITNENILEYIDKEVFSWRIGRDSLGFPLMILVLVFEG